MSLYVGRQSYGASFGASFGSSGLKGVVTLAAPVNTGAPSISGFAAPGNVLTANNGAWTGYPNPTYAYQWKADASNIVGETGATYSIVLADVGKTISIAVTATNSQGNASASATGVLIASDPPVNTVAPAISGTATVGAALSVSNGTWSGHPAATFAYQWKRNGSNISSATSNTYTLVSADAGNPITCTVTATNTSGSASATSSATSNVTSAPANTVAPAISGTTGLGDTLTVSNGTWTGSPTPSYAYQWTRDGSNIAAAASATYVIVAADGGHTVACVVTATNSVGSGSASATGSSVSAFTSPSNTVAPTISGTANVGSTLTASTGTWTGNPSSFSYAYQWYWGDTVTPISGATSSTYTPVSGDAGHTIIVNVTATNAIGSTSQGSSATSAVSAILSPVLEFSPTVRPAGTSMARQGKVVGSVTLNKSSHSGLITDSTLTSSYADSNGIFKVDGATENIVFHGDSITEGTFAWESYVPKLVRRAWMLKGKACNYKNRGINGQGFNYAYPNIPRVLQTLTADAPNSVDPCRTGTLNDWLVIFAGTNDIALNGASGSACYTLFDTYFTARVAAGWTASKIVVVTALPRGASSTDISAYNVLLASNQASKGYLLVDLRNDSRLTNETNTTYFHTDGIHPNDAGQQAITEDIQAVMFP